jgi:hypothetical protein
MIDRRLQKLGREDFFAGPGSAPPDHCSGPQQVVGRTAHHCGAFRGCGGSYSVAVAAVVLGLWLGYAGFAA